MAEPGSYVIIGNGIAGVTAAETLRGEDVSAEITVIGDHPMPVYTRPALKDFLAGRAGEDDLYARRRSFYADHHIHFIFDRAIGVDAAAHTAYLSSGRRIYYNRLLLATGGRARHLTCPGSNLVGIVTLRTIADFQSARRLLETTRRVVVVGAGPVAGETVEVLHHRGYHVTHLLRGRRLWPAMLDAMASDLVLQQERREGVDVHTEEEIVEIAGQQGRVVGIVTRSGARIPCDLVISAIGSEPAIDFIAASGIACARGVKVDHAMRTSVPDIFAAGDVAEVIDPGTGQPRCIGQWYPSIQQGRTAAYAMLGLLDTQHLLHPSMHSNAYLRSITCAYLFGCDIAAVGITTPNALVAPGALTAPIAVAPTPAYQEVFADPGAHLYSKALLQDGVLIGVLSFDGRRDMLAYKRAIDHAVSLAPVASHLFSQDFKLANWLDSQKVPTPVLAVRKPRVDNDVHNIKTGPLALSARARKPQFALSARAWGDSYTMPIVSAVGYTAASATHGYAPTGYPQGASLHIQAPGATMLRGDMEIAFLAPILPMETVRALQKAMPDGSGGNPYRLSLRGDTAQSAVSDEYAVCSLAPEWSHTMLTAGQTVTIGRDSSSTLVLNHATVSRHHADITSSDDGQYCLRDLGSKNGTFVNGTRLEPHRDHTLQPRDQIRIGTLLTFLFDRRAIPRDILPCI